MMRRLVLLSLCTGAAAYRSPAPRRAALARLAQRGGAALFGGAALVAAPRRGAAAFERGMFNEKTLTDVDIYGTTGRRPPRVFDTKLLESLNAPPTAEELEYARTKKPGGSKLAKGESYNAWGLCIDDSCTYIPLKRRRDGYKNYEAAVHIAASTFADARAALRARRLGDASLAQLVDADGEVVAGLRAGLLMSNKLLLTENTGVTFDALVARYYVNEAFCASRAVAALLATAGQGGDDAAGAVAAALAAADEGRDAFNSFFTVVNRAIVPKVGEKFEPIPA